VVFSPVYFTTEYLIREPIGALVSAAERSNVPQVLYDFFLFGPDHKAGVVPTIFFDFGFSPSVGLLGFWNDAGFKRNNLSAHFSIWTSDWIAGSVGDSIGFGKASAFAVKLAALRRPDRTFFGIGPNSLQGNLSRYGETRLEGSGTFDVPLWHSSQLQAGSGYRTVNLYNGDYGGDPTVTRSCTARTQRPRDLARCTRRSSTTRSSRSTRGASASRLACAWKRRRSKGAIFARAWGPDGSGTRGRPECFST
jgi:hypothetical protein